LTYNIWYAIGISPCDFDKDLGLAGFPSGPTTLFAVDTCISATDMRISLKVDQEALAPRSFGIIVI
jgi:hypothetical protein